jgi:site-specific DNA-methyltransferase (adenine-specific)/site-specific DNA-methyltransferase (cytosine-N4-specific)
MSETRRLAAILAADTRAALADVLNSIHPDHFAEWFLTFHEPLLSALKPSGSLILNIKDKVIDGARHRYVWDTIQALISRGRYPIDDYI